MCACLSRFLPQSPHSVCVGVLFWGRRGGLSCFEVCQFAQEHSSLLFWHLDACSHFFPRKHLPWVGCLVFCLQWSIIIRCVSSVASVNLVCSVCRATAPVPVSSAISEWSGCLATIARWRHNRVAQLQPFDSVMNTYWKYTKPPRSALLLHGTRELSGPFWERDCWPARPDPTGPCGRQPNTGALMERGATANPRGRSRAKSGPCDAMLCGDNRDECLWHVSLCLKVSACVHTSHKS